MKLSWFAFIILVIGLVKVFDHNCIIIFLSMFSYKGYIAPSRIDV